MPMWPQFPPLVTCDLLVLNRVICVLPLSRSEAGKMKSFSEDGTDSPDTKKTSRPQRSQTAKAVGGPQSLMIWSSMNTLNKLYVERFLGKLIDYFFLELLFLGTV